MSHLPFRLITRRGLVFVEEPVGFVVPTLIEDDDGDEIEVFLLKDSINETVECSRYKRESENHCMKTSIDENDVLR